MAEPTDWKTARMRRDVFFFALSLMEEVKSTNFSSLKEGDS